MNIKFLSAIFTALATLVITSCGENTTKSDTDTLTNNTDQTTVADSTGWKRINPTDVKNAVELFDKDWMALAVGKEGDMNAMTISWGSMGELWGRPVIIVYVSSSRYTYEFMERNKYFTVTGFPEEIRSSLTYIGTHSGRDGDKLKEAGLTPEFTDLGNPIFKEANLAIECKIIYSAPFDRQKMDPDAAQIYDRNGMGIHTMYIGEILNVWEK